MDTNILEKLERIEKLLETQQAMQKQASLKFSTCFCIACIYLELSQSHLYKLTSTGSIPHYKPNGKKLYFNRQELDNWLLRNRSNSIDEIEQEAANYLIKKGRVQL
ncbi:MAG: helix-turn-helix domain-containing protein [Flavobacterium sp.]